jgi:putative CocE/NonD family hydrolase
MSDLSQMAIGEVKWMKERLRAIVAKHLILPFIKIPATTPEEYSKYRLDKNVPIRMRDGISLYADVYRPPAEGKYPVILVRLPYGKDEAYCMQPAFGRFWAKRGYVYVVQDVRGKFKSEGVMESYGSMVVEGKDGYDTLDWISEQEWCDGNIGMMGFSYFGLTQWAVAHMNHPNLKCIVPGIIDADSYRSTYTGGAFHLQITLGWIAHTVEVQKRRNTHNLDYWHLPLDTADEAAGIHSPAYKDVIGHPTRDEFWLDLSVMEYYADVQIPVLHVGGWYDVYLIGTIDGYLGVSNNSKSQEAREHQWLLIGGLDHEFSPVTSGRIGQLQLGNRKVRNVGGYSKTFWSYDRYQRFFDYWLKRRENGFDETPRIEIFVMGDNQWRFENEWPLARTRFTNYYLHSKGSANTLEGNGILDTNEPGEEPPDTFVYDPDDPVAVTVKVDQWSMARDLKDRTAVEKRDDVLVYSSIMLEKELEITGPMTVTLFAASSAKDTDFTATLGDVFPDGYVHMIQEGIIRASYRDPAKPPTLIEPERVYEYTIDLIGTSYVFKRGHRIRVEISSSNFNRFDRNPNTGDPVGTAVHTVKALQTVYHTLEYPSHITLPIIPR